MCRLPERETSVSSTLVIQFDYSGNWQRQCVSPPPHILAALTEALTKLQKWYWRGDRKPVKDQCGCHKSRGRQRCLMHQIDHVLRDSGTTRGVWTFQLWLVRLMRRIDKILPSTAQCDCESCLMCRARKSLRMSQQWARGTEVQNGVAQKGGRQRIYDKCRNGHEITKETLIVTKDGHRACRICARDQSRRYARKKRAGKPHKRIPGMCRPGLHALEGDNVRVIERVINGKLRVIRTCVACDKIRRQSALELSRARRARQPAA